MPSIKLILLFEDLRCGYNYYMNNIIFLAGIHGVGKTTLSQQMTNGTEIKSVSASNLIKSSLKNINLNKKITDNIVKNQNHLLRAIEENLDPQSKYIMDGHFCLLNKNREVEKIPLSTFIDISPLAIIVLYDDLNKVFSRLQCRDKINVLDKKTLNAMQKCELEHGFFIAHSLGIPFLSCNISSNLIKANKIIELFL